MRALVGGAKRRQWPDPCYRQLGIVGPSERHRRQRAVSTLTTKTSRAEKMLPLTTIENRVSDGRGVD